MKRVPIIILLTALLVGLCLLFDKCATNEIVKPDIEQVKQAEKKVSSIHKNYEQALNKLKVHSDSLQKELTQTQIKLKAVKTKLNQSQHSLVTLIEKDTAGLSIRDRLEDCDSLKAQAVNYVGLVDSTKSAYEKNISQLGNLLATKDTQLLVCRSSYTQLKDLIDENLQRERKLTEDLNTAYKKQRRKVIQNRLLAGGFLILSGITTTLFINANK